MPKVKQAEGCVPPFLGSLTREQGGHRKECCDEGEDDAVDYGHVSATKGEAEHSDEPGEHSRHGGVDCGRSFESLIVAGALDRRSDNLVANKKLFPCLTTS